MNKNSFQVSVAMIGTLVDLSDTTTDANANTTSGAGDTTSMGGDTTSDNLSLHDPALDIIKSETRDDLSSLSSSPKFSRQSFFDDMSLFDPDYFGVGGSSSRSSSTSVEDLSFSGRRSASMMSSISSPSDYNLAALVEDEVVVQQGVGGGGGGEGEAALRRWSDKTDLTEEEEAEILSGKR